MKRKTIAVLLDYMTFFGGGYEEQLREQLDAHCQRVGYDLLLVYGGRHAGQVWLNHHPDNAQRSPFSEVFELIDAKRIDALIVLSAVLASYASIDWLTKLFARYSPLPACSVGTEIPGVPSVVVNNEFGMRGVIEHLLDEHGCRRFAFLGGAPESPESQLRLKVCQQVLRERALPWDDILVEAGYFVTSAGADAMERILARGGQFDAVIAANDHMALGAVDALRRRGLRVPAHRIVTGFDDIRLAGLGTPSLTTVRQPFAEMVETALRLIEGQMENQSVALVTELSPELVVRRSCGCAHQRLPQLVREVTAGADPRELLENNADRLRAGLRAELEGGGADAQAGADALLDGLARDLSGERNTFAQAVEQLHQLGSRTAEHHRAVQNAVDLLHRELHDVTNPELEAAFYGAMHMIALANTTAHVNQELEAHAASQSLLAAGDEIAAVLDIRALQEVLHSTLPRAGFPTVFVARFVERSTTQLAPCIRLVDGLPVEEAPTHFPVGDLFPRSGYSNDKRRTYAAFPLDYERRLVGFAVFGVQGAARDYHAARDQIGASLRTIGLHEELVNQMVHNEQKRLKSLSVLAGGVAHDLNNALGPVVALPEVILDRLRSLNLTEVAADVCSDVLFIQQATLRASQSIGDLLTLGRQGQVVHRPLNLSKAVADCIDARFLQNMTELNPLVDVNVSIEVDPLPIRGSVAQISRAFTNLVRNAVEAMGKDGNVTVSLRFEQVSQAIGGYERVEPGRYGVLEVKDSGAGIRPSDLDHVFDPFFSRKETRSHSGTGLGLAIVHSVIKEHGGFIDVASERGAGTTFTLYFPTTLDSVRPSSPVSVPAAKSGRILIVDDDPIQVRTGRRVLTHHGYQADAVNSGQTALERFRAAQATGKTPYDLVLLDMVLNEELDGLEVYERIREWFPQQRAIIASGHASTDRIEAATRHGLGWLAKPYTASGLVRAVAKALTSNPPKS